MIKHFILTLLIGVISLNSFAQDLDLPPNPKPGNCYIRCKDDSGKYLDWQTIDCELSWMVHDSVRFKTLQIKMNNYGYDVDVNGRIDLKTITAYKKYTKDEKKRLRKAKKKR